MNNSICIIFCYMACSRFDDIIFFYIVNVYTLNIIFKSDDQFKNETMKNMLN